MLGSQSWSQWVPAVRSPRFHDVSGGNWIRGVGVGQEGDRDRSGGLTKHSAAFAVTSKSRNIITEKL